MNDEGKNWFDELKRFAKQRRTENPIVTHDDLSPLQEEQCQIIGSYLVGWFEEDLTNLVSERAIIFKQLEEDPYIVFTTDRSGLVAANDIFKEGAPLAYLTHEEFTEFSETHPDPEYRWHIHKWSYFTPFDEEAIDEESAKEASLFPLAPGESYWLHEEGMMRAALAGQGADHLWKWNGEELVLVKDFVRNWVS